MIPFLIRRFFNLIPVVFGGTILIFFIISLAPGDFLTPLELSPNISREEIENLRRNFGLDQPVPVQYFNWLSRLVQGDFGISFLYQQPVLEVAWPRMLNSLYLGVLGIVMFYLFGIPLGIYGAVRQNSLGDKMTSTVMYILLGFPTFFLALLVIYLTLQVRFATGWDIPIGGLTSRNHDELSALGRVWDIAKHIFLPALVLTLSTMAGFTRYMRAQMLENLNHDYVRTARAKGLNERTVIYKHTFRNAIIPFVASIGTLLVGAINGSGLIEVVYSYPGITPMLLDALNSRDLYLLAGFNVLTMLLLVIGLAISDILLTLVDPRIRYD